MTNNPENKIEQEIMDEIKNGQLKPLPKYLFQAEKIGIGTIIVLSLILAILFFNLGLFYLKASGNLVYLSFGRQGIYAFFEAFPYLLAVNLILFVVIAGLIIKKSGTLYQKSFIYLAAGLISLVVVFGFVLTYTGLAREIEKKTYQHPGLGIVFHPFKCNGEYDRRLSITGRIIRVEDSLLELQTLAKIHFLDLSHLKKIPEDQLIEGMFISAIGKANGNMFEATNIYIANDDEIPMIKHCLQKLFENVNQSNKPLR